jgi:hypothetical protein
MIHAVIILQIISEMIRIQQLNLKAKDPNLKAESKHGLHGSHALHTVPGKQSTVF